jgi:hypothetical protein
MKINTTDIYSTNLIMNTERLQDKLITVGDELLFDCKLAQEILSLEPRLSIIEDITSKEFARLRQSLQAHFKIEHAKKVGKILKDLRSSQEFYKFIQRILKESYNAGDIICTNLLHIPADKHHSDYNRRFSKTLICSKQITLGMAKLLGSCITDNKTVEKFLICETELPVRTLLDIVGIERVDFAEGVEEFLELLSITELAGSIDACREDINSPMHEIFSNPYYYSFTTEELIKREFEQTTQASAAYMLSAMCYGATPNCVTTLRAMFTVQKFANLKFRERLKFGFGDFVDTKFKDSLNGVMADKHCRNAVFIPRSIEAVMGTESYDAVQERVENINKLNEGKMKLALCRL